MLNNDLLAKKNFQPSGSVDQEDPQLLPPKEEVQSKTKPEEQELSDSKVEQEAKVNELHASHEENSSEQKPKKNDSNKISYANFALQVTNGFSFAGNFLGLLSEVVPGLKSLKEPLSKFAAIGTKSFFIVNGAISSVMRFKEKNILGLLGYLYQIGVGILSPHNIAYLLKGPTLTLNQGANMLNMLNQRHKFDSFADNIKHIKETMNKAKNAFFKNPFNDWNKENNATAGLWGAVLSAVGTAAWLVTGNKALGATIRNAGGLAIDLEQIKPYQKENGRHNYVKSGWLYIVGTFSEWFSKISPEFEAPFRYMSFIFDSTGTMFQSIAENKGELKQNKKKAETA